MCLSQAQLCPCWMGVLCLPCCVLFFSVQTHCSATQRGAVGWLIAKCRMCLLVVLQQILETRWLVWFEWWWAQGCWEIAGGKAQMLLQDACVYLAVGDPRLCRVWHVHLHFFPNPTERERSSFTLDHRSARFLWLQCKEWWEWSGMQSLDGLQCVYLDLDRCVCPVSGGWQQPGEAVRSDIPVKCAALCCSAVVSLCLLLGFMFSRVRLLLLKQRNSIKLVKLNRKFSVHGPYIWWAFLTVRNV